jgi:hypothetical protein
MSPYPCLEALVYDLSIKKEYKLEFLSDLEDFQKGGLSF